MKIQEVKLDLAEVGKEKDTKGGKVNEDGD